MIPDDGHRIEIVIGTQSEEVRFGRSVKDVLLQKEVDNRYGRKTYAKHILDWAHRRLGYVEVDELDVEYTGEPTAVLMTHNDVQEFTDRCVNDE